jgi:hypothetical protein
MESRLAHSTPPDPWLVALALRLQPLPQILRGLPGGAPGGFVCQAEESVFGHCGGVWLGHPDLAAGIVAAHLHGMAPCVEQALVERQSHLDFAGDDERQSWYGARDHVPKPVVVNGA